MITIEEINRYANNRENFEKLVDLCISEYVVPYIGAGLSDFANKKTGLNDKFYTWWNYLSVHYYDCFKEKLVNNADLYKTADLIEKAKGKEKFHESIRTTYGYYLSEEKWNIILDKAKDEAISIIPELFNGPIITTNFDQILEKIHNPMHPVYLPYDEDAFGKLRNVVKERHPSIYKVHGSVSNVDKIIFTGKSYNKAYKPDSELVKTLSDFYKGFCFLFLGCSLKMSEQEMDKSIKLWTNLTNTGMSHFAILEEPNDLEKRQEELEKQNIKPIFFPKGKFEAIKVILSEILKRKKSVFGKIPEYKSTFIKRTKITEKIEQRLGKSNYSAFALIGTAGVGKTRIMREYAFEKQNTHIYKKIVWFNAISKANILSETYQFALDENLIKDRTNENQEDTFKKVKNWMVENDNWLFLLDNVENYQDIKELLFFDSKVTKKGKRHFLITTRKSNLPFNNEVIDIFDEGESQFFLHSYTKLKSNNFSRKIALKLGYLPLALEQAAAYIKKNKIDYQQYFKKLKESLEILKQGRAESRTLSVEATWNVSMRMIENEEPKQLLNLCAFFAPDNIYCRWFSDASEQLNFYYPLQEKLKDENEYKKILYELAEYSLVRIENEKISIHRLLQEIIRKNSKKELITTCVQIMDKHCFFDFSTIEQFGYFAEITPHIITLTGYSSVKIKECVNLYLFLGFGHNALSNYSEALKWYKKALLINKKSMSDISTVYNNIAIVYNNQGNYSEALKWYKKALVIDKKVLKKNHFDTAKVYNNIAVVYNNQGKYSEALNCNQKALTINEKNGEKKSNIAAIYSNRASIYDNQGNYSEALKWYKKALAINIKTLGMEHPDTVVMHNNIAGVYHEQGNYPEALKWYKKALVSYEKVFGKNYSLTAIIYNNMALIYNNQEKFSEALTYNQEALIVNEKIFGQKNFNMATTYSIRASIYDSQGNYSEALKWYKKALVINEKVLGKEHLNTATTYDSIGLVYHHKGKYTEALEWYEKALDIHEKILGRKHYGTAITYNNIAGIYDNQENYSEALKWYKKALVINEKVLGKEHPTTATIYSNIAGVYYEQNKYSEALKLHKKSLIIREKILGKKHSDTAITYNNIAGVYNKQGKYSDALKWYRKALLILEKVLGKEHPITAIIYDNIAGVYDNRKNYPKALK